MCTVHTHFGPPTGQHKVCVNVLLSKLLSHVEPQGAVLVINVAFGRVVQDGMGIVDLFKLVRCLRIVWVLVRVVFQGQFPLRKRWTIASVTNYCIYVGQLECRAGMKS